MVVCVAWERSWDFSPSRRSSASESARQKCVYVLGTARAVSVVVGALILEKRLNQVANLTKRMWGLIPAPSLQTRHDQSANWSNPKVDLQTR